MGLRVHSAASKSSRHLRAPPKPLRQLPMQTGKRPGDSVPSSGTARAVTVSSSAVVTPRFYRFCFTMTPADLPPKEQAMCQGHSFLHRAAPFPLL